SPNVYQSVQPKILSGLSVTSQLMDVNKTSRVTTFEPRPPDFHEDINMRIVVAIQWKI
ncbi:FMRFamide receptor-like X1, partial [Biomphalaria glabrata]